MDKNFFRNEFLNSKTDAHLGQTLSMRPLAFSLIAGFFIFFAIISVFYLCLAQYTKKERVTGLLVPDKGLIKVYSPQSGVVSARFIREGEVIAAGTMLYSISSERGRMQGVGTETTVISLLKQRADGMRLQQRKQLEITTLERSEIAARIASIQLEIDTLRSQQQSQRQRIDIADANFARQQILFEQKYISQPQLLTQRDSLIEQQSKLKEIDRALITVEREQHSLSQSLVTSNLKVDSQKLILLHASQELDQQVTEQEARRTVTVVSPVSGQVASVLIKPGQAALPSEPLMTILPTGFILEAQLHIPTRAAGFIHNGQKVQIRYAAYPYQKFGSYTGTIIQIDQNATTSGELNMQHNDSGSTDGVYFATVKLDKQHIDSFGQNTPLRPGMTFDADIAVDTRNLIEWFFEPLFTVARRI